MWIFRQRQDYGVVRFLWLCISWFAASEFFSKSLIWLNIDHIDRNIAKKKKRILVKSVHHQRVVRMVLHADDNYCDCHHCWEGWTVGGTKAARWWYKVSIKVKGYSSSGVCDVCKTWTPCLRQWNWAIQYNTEFDIWGACGEAINEKITWFSEKILQGGLKILRFSLAPFWLILGF